MIKTRERTAILSSIAAGTVPNIGLQYLQVGRKREVEALLRNLETVAQGGSMARLISAPYGAGKTFLLKLAANLARHQNLVVVEADVTTARPLITTDKDTPGLYSELVRNMSVRAKPDGNALANVLEAFLAPIRHTVTSKGGSDLDVLAQVAETLRGLHSTVGGFEYARVVQRYCEAVLMGDSELGDTALRWLRGEFRIRSEFKKALGISRSMMGDRLHEHLKLLAQVCRLAGFGGLLVAVDEMGVLSYKLTHARSRGRNFEEILTILNDCYQGNVSGLGYLFAGVPEFLRDDERGLFSYPALRTRLAESRFNRNGLTDYAAPVIDLPTMSLEELMQLLRNIRSVHAEMDESKILVPDECLEAILRQAAEKPGPESELNPRTLGREFVALLNLLDQNSELRWQDLVAKFAPPALPAGEAAAEVESELAAFRL